MGLRLGVRRLFPWFYHSLIKIPKSMEITGSSIDDVVWSAAAGHSNNAPNVEATKPKLTFHIGGVGGWSTLVPKMVGAKKSAGPTNYCEMHGKCMVCTITSLLSCQRYFGLNTRSSTRSTSSTSPKKKKHCLLIIIQQSERLKKHIRRKSK